jgi:hypothetical protein
MDEISDNFLKAQKEMVRVDHLIFVSLKYSRTVDVIKSVVKRIISTFDIAMTCALESKLKGEELKNALHGPKTMRDAMRKEFPETKEFIKFYKFLRELDKAKVKARLNEFRRHVTLVADVAGEEQHVKIETVEEYFEKTKEFVDLLKHIAGKK